jgi:magnesium chelatase family protein
MQEGGMCRRAPPHGVGVEGWVVSHPRLYGAYPAYRKLRRERSGCRRSVHNLLMLGPPGAGTSRLARRLTTLLPAMRLAEALETTCLHRVAGRTGARTTLVTTRPCRAPHHTISDVGLIGGGHVPMPGEVSLAHNGVLFLDELPEFRRHVLEVLRQPLEDGLIYI